ncbi:MAG: choice-of-anchor L domain-containing protein [Saprospiraceae bacterium]|nr:choice-of-anchor L domain-containing protein [Saprospiraceae bacterium]
MPLWTGLFLLTLSQVSFGQTLQAYDANSAPFTPENLISNIFLGDGVEVTNITYKGDPVSVGYFTGGMQAVGIERGIIMTSGRVETGNVLLNEYGVAELGQETSTAMINSFPQSDPDLASVTSGVLFDNTIYTITFIPISDTLRFRYSFASEEYPEYVCSQFNDVFGFFIQGPGYPVPTNIALIPNTNMPVAINNLHPLVLMPALGTGPCAAINAQYYLDNDLTQKQPCFDGITQVFTAEAIVVPCQTYTIKLAISDVGDWALDSGVFLEAKSFGTGNLRAELATPGLDGTVTEGCASGMLSFKLPTPATQDFPLDYKILGTATNGLDYQTIPANLFIAQGSTSVSVPIVAFEDNLSESNEYLAIDVRRDPCHRDTILIFLRDNTIQGPDLLKDTARCLGAASLSLNGTLPVPVPQPPSFSNATDLSISPVNTTLSSTVNVFGVFPTVLQPGMIRSVCVNINHAWVDDLDLYLVSPGGQFLELMTDCGANGKNFTNTCFTPLAPQKIGQATAVQAPFTGNWQPEGLWSDLWSGLSPVNGAWKLQLIDDQNGIVGTLTDWSITFEPLYEINYQWTPGTGLSCPSCPLTDATPAASTTYTLQATDSYGCQVRDSVRVQVGQSLSAPALTCGNSTNDNISFDWTAVAGASGYEVSINGGPWLASSGSNSHLVDGLNPGAQVTLAVRATGGSSAFCPALVASAVCSNCKPPLVGKTEKPETWSGIGNGSVTLTTDNANPPYTFQLNAQTNTTGIFTNLLAGNYTATITDNSGCETLVAVGIGSSTLVVTITPTNVTCFAGDDGKAAATVTGGVLPLTFKWSDAAGQTIPTAVNLKAGTYTVTVTGADGCVGTASVTLTQPPDIVIFVTASPAKCFGDSTGSATVTVQGGVAPLQYAWSNGQTGPMAVNLPAGSYAITVTDAKLCAKTSFALIGQPTQIQANATTNAVTCNGLSNGSATVTASGGIPPLTYKWSDPAGQTTTTAGNLAAGIYTVTVTDKNNCVRTQTATVTEPPAIQLSVAGTNASCNGSSTASAIASASGGNGVLSYKWSDPAGQTTATASNLAAGTYTVTVTDANGCTRQSTVVLTQPAALTLTPTVTAASCFDAASGQIDVLAQGGTTPYTYNWSSSETTPGIQNKPAGIYTVTVTDANGCTGTSVSTITQPADLVLSATPTAAKCFGAASGSATASATGGTNPLQFNWSNGQNNTATITNLAAGAFTVTVVDAKGCTKSLSVNVGQASQLTATTTAVAVTCNGLSNGSATVAPAGGTTPCTYKWSDTNGQTTATASNLAAGTYTVTVTDFNLCTLTQTAVITAPPAIVLNVTRINVSCNALSDGSASATASGGAGGLVYQWSDPSGQSTPTATNLAAGTYTVTVTDANGCTKSSSITVNEPPALTLAPVVQQVACFGGATGSIQLNAQGGATPYTYQWSSGENTAGIQNKIAGPYSATVTDNNGCSSVYQGQITENTELLVQPFKKDVQCFGAADGSIQLAISGGAGSYTINWSGPGGFTGSGQILSNLVAGAYNATITDGAGCSKTQSVNLSQPASAVLASLPATADTICFGGNNGSAIVLASGGTTPYVYAWSVPAQTNPGISGLSVGAYTVTVTDANNCTSTASTFIYQKEQIFVWTEAGAVDCFGSNNGTAKVTQLYYGATPASLTAFSYVWSTIPAQNTVEAFGLQATQTYTVTVTDNAGCSGTQTVTMGNAPMVIASFVTTANPKCFNGTDGLLLVLGSGGSSPYTYTWSPNVGSAIDSLAQGLSAGVYMVTATDAKGCSGSSSITLSHPPAIDVHLVASNVLCFGENNGTATAQASGGTPGYQYQWSTGGSGSSIQNVPAGMLQVTVTDSNGCSRTEQVEVEQPDTPLGGASTQEDVACFGGYTGQIQISGSGGTPPYRYSLNNGPWNGSSKQIGLKAGIYIPRIQDSKGCIAELAPVEIQQLPALVLDLGPSITIELGTNTQLFASVQNANGNVQYSWSPEDSLWLSCLDCPNPFVDSLFVENWFTLSVEDELGCQAKDQVLVIVEKPRKVFVPTGFSPNSDGNNDALFPHGQHTARMLSFQVFDRWGELLFQSNNFMLNDPASGWDGRFRGEDMNPGVYVWVLEVEYLDGVREVLKGNTTLIR